MDVTELQSSHFNFWLETIPENVWEFLFVCVRQRERESGWTEKTFLFLLHESILEKLEETFQIFFSVMNTVRTYKQDHSGRVTQVLRTAKLQNVMFELLSSTLILDNECDSWVRSG